jgi:NAD+ kinase
VYALRKILITPNPFKPEALELTGPAVRLLREHGFEPVLEAATAARLGETVAELRDETGLWEEIDLALVLGGDGSMLNAARRIYPRQIPLLGVNLGQLGFLTRVESHRLNEALVELAAGSYTIERRAMLEAQVVRDKAIVETVVALNDLVVSKSSFARMVRLETWIDEEYFTTYPADGLIVATATGSTAYSLSAGGPILDPRLRAILITPICAHSLYARPLVLSKAARIKVIMDAGHNDLILTADGQSGVELAAGDEVHFHRAPFVTRLLRFKNEGLFETLKSRLKEGKI